MKERFEEQYTDVLQNIEFAIVNTYRSHPKMTDYSVMEALDAVIGIYDREARGRSAPPRMLPELDQELRDKIHQMCEWRLGLTSLVSEKRAGKVPSPAPLTVEEILNCLKRVRSSVNRCNKVGGRQGYLDFVRQYVR